MFKKMLKTIAVLLGSIFILSLQSCSPTRHASTTASGLRNIILGDEKYLEGEMGGFISWCGRDFVYGGTVQVEVGYFGNPAYEGLGFILYDGGDIGQVASYRRTGLEHRWDWGPKGTEYAFVIKTDGTGLYYDFTTVEEGKTTTAKEVYKCRKR